MIESEFLQGNTLAAYKYFIKLGVLSTFNKNGRYINFDKLTPKERCWQCSKSFLYIKDQRKKHYCSPECSRVFYLQYHFPFKKLDILKKAHYRCQKCFKSFIKIKERWDTENFQPMGKYIQIKEELYFRYEIDHIRELATATTQLEAGELFLNDNNLQVLCPECHKEKTAIFLNKFFSKPKIIQEITIPIKKNKLKKLMDYI
jgi:5-methylcytosine-specific restriction endonuclease McrA